MDFATKLKCYRNMFNLTQNAIAEAMGVDRSTYSYYESGKTLPTADGIRFLSRLFGVSPATLLNEKPIEPPKFSFDKLVFCDSANDNSLEEEMYKNIDMSFPELTDDEKEMIALYRVMKAAEANSDLFGKKRENIIKRFLSDHYK